MDELVSAVVDHHVVPASGIGHHSLQEGLVGLIAQVNVFHDTRMLVQVAGHTVRMCAILVIHLVQLHPCPAAPGEIVLPHQRGHSLLIYLLDVVSASKANLEKTDGTM